MSMAIPRSLIELIAIDANASQIDHRPPLNWSYRDFEHQFAALTLQEEPLWSSAGFKV